MPLDNLTELRRRVPGGKYNLARAVAERARQLQSGESSPLVEVKSPNPLSVAIEEIVQGKISFTVTKEGEVGHSDYIAPDEELLAAPEVTDETIFGSANESDDAIVADGRVIGEERLVMEENEAQTKAPRAKRAPTAADAEAEAAEAQEIEREDEEEDEA